MTQYKDVRVGKGSQLAEALSDKDSERAAVIYWEAEQEFQKYVQGTQWAKDPAVVTKALNDAKDKYAKAIERRAKAA